jgi:hypothetical protein
MADNYAFTAGSGTTAAADDIGGVLHPRAKMQHGADGSATDVSTASPLPVGQKIDWIQVTPTLDTSIYASGDLLFDVATITSAALATGGAVELVSVMVLDEDDQGTAIDLYVTNLSTTWGTINNALAATDALGRGVQAYVPIAAADFVDIGGCKIAQPRVAQNIGVICETSGSANLYLVGACRSGTPTYTASGLRISLGFRQTAVS